MIRTLCDPIRISTNCEELLPINGNTLFICHASYEPRAYAVTSGDLTELNLTSAVIVATSASLQRNEKYRACDNELKRRLGALINAVPHGLECNRHELFPLIVELDRLVKQHCSQTLENVIVDATVFPKDRLWVVLDYIKRSMPQVRVVVLYAEPDAYNTEIADAGWLSKGVKSIEPIPRFNGYQSAQKRALLVIIVGHEQERMQITIKNTEADKVILIGQGLQQHSASAPNLSDVVVRHLGQDYANVVDKSEIKAVGSRDYLGVSSALTSISSRYGGDYNIVVAANGTKLQSLGALLACQTNRAIRAIYAEPQIYNDSSYSLGSGDTWGIQL